jgi:hypothetical protein
MEKDFIIRTRRIVRLGPMHIDLRSNEKNFGGLQYFVQAANAGADYVVNCCNTRLDGPWSGVERDRTYRAKRFAAGYYITDHFGAPASIVQRGHQYWIFAEDFEPMLWPYVVKILLTLHSIEHDRLHLKAAAVAVEGRGTLLVGRGGAGKTVLLARLCERGATFLANTHVLLKGDRIIAVPSAMRVRRDASFAPVIERRGLREGFKAGEYVADPIRDLGWQPALEAPLNNVCLIDYRGPGECILSPIEGPVLYEYLEQFSLPLNVYGLKEDLLDHFGGSVDDFALQMHRMKSQLHALVENSHGYRVSCDASDDKGLDALHDLLAGRRGS